LGLVRKSNCQSRKPIKTKKIQMKHIAIILILYIAFISHVSAQQTDVKPLQPCKTVIEGNYGKNIDLVIDNRIVAQDIDELINPFKKRNECRYWQTEFWGKWMSSAVDAYQYKPNEELKQKIDIAVRQLVATQTPEGYIGNYADTCHLRFWDVWGRKYTILGLMKWYGITKDTMALRAATRVAEHLMSETGPGKTDLYKTGNFRGMPSSTVLEPMVLLYKATKQEKYLNYCRYIIEQWENMSDGPKLISKALAFVPVSERFSIDQKDWWSWKNGQKAYEMMNCYKSMLDFHEVKPNPKYLQSVINTASDIVLNEINIAGSGTSSECWYKGKHNQTRVASNAMETCVTFTWMQLCAKLFSLTADSKWADQFELTAYNALAASMRKDGSTFMKYPPLCGLRGESDPQYGMTFLNCCIANGPRGFLLVPPMAVMHTNNKVFINFYSDLKSEVKLDGGSMTLQQFTQYPKDGDVEMIINVKKDFKFSLNLRVPEFSKSIGIKINGETITGIASKGYLSIERFWKNNDKIKVVFDMSPRIQEQDAHIAFMYGPVLLAADQRFNKEYIEEVVSLPTGQTSAQLEKLEPTNNCLMRFKAMLRMGPNPGKNGGTLRELILCDFPSAGSTWGPDSRYRVWLPLILFPYTSNNKSE